MQIFLRGALPFPHVEKIGEQPEGIEGEPDGNEELVITGDRQVFEGKEDRDRAEDAEAERELRVAPGAEIDQKRRRHDPEELPGQGDRRPFLEDEEIEKEGRGQKKPFAEKRIFSRLKKEDRRPEEKPEIYIEIIHVRL